MHSKNQIVSLCAKLCEHSKSIVASIFENSMSKLKNTLNSVNTVDNDIRCISSAINELYLIRDWVLDADWPVSF